MNTAMKMQQIWWATAFCASAVALFASGARAQEAPVENGTSLDEFGSQAAIHATRLDYSRFDLPVSATVITQEDIRRYGFVEISEIFRIVPGFRIVKIGDESRVSYHGMTARQNRRMKVTINGKNVLVGFGAYVEFDRLPIELEDIAKITITRGPNGATFGDNAFVASIDFITRRLEEGSGVSVRGGLGAVERRKYGAGLAEEFGSVALNFAAAYEHDGGYPYNDAQQGAGNNGRAIKRAHMELRNVGEKSTWGLEANGYDSEQKIGSRQLGLAGIQSNNGYFVALSNQRQLNAESRLDWLVSYNSQNELTRSDGCLTPANTLKIRQFITNPVLLPQVLAMVATVPRLLGAAPSDTCLYFDINDKSYRADAEVEYENRVGNGRYLLGGSATDIKARSAERFAGIDQKQRSYRIFGEADYGWKRAHGSLGFMWQHSDNAPKSELAFRGAGNWHLNQSQTVHYSFARSFRVPSLVESETIWSPVFRFGRRGTPFSSYALAFPFPVIRNPIRIKSETIDSHEIGYFAVLARSRLELDVKVFHDKIKDPVEAGWFYFDPPPTNQAAFTLKGAEVDVTARLTDHVRLKGHYSYLDNTALRPFELGMHGQDAGSLAFSYDFSPGHSLTAAYYGNSTISGNSYDRYDLVYALDKRIGTARVRPQLIYQRHVGGVDGLKNANPALASEGYLANLNQLYLYFDVQF